MLDRLLEQGIEYLFVSNSDNLGATLDTTLLQYFATSGKAFLMEVRGFEKTYHLRMWKATARSLAPLPLVLHHWI